ncbi:Exocyst complex component [Komagataella phaffii CBS 7435]|uniref:Exocyst complex component EXO84 n=2 Tax=Komagataella phaffii TaxID=460519 RepID=C4R6S9_KOMPG|nr:Essential protein with dual roles in spliceosome assembly and exocytosis [Komagataella phaffii GS115]AOA65281.1 GQ67_04386T0 [Komagataella phaffii]CAH2451352.1 Exocyst complex component [Komagataella phaffii CBS 7435]AOA70216.1 GQ68_04358T0 [Komagataella phaffii GS115]CAY71304.1 Essential protein with dual roles in spliceosome assembly and exocytosis [Komagataella phaffii GS115]CCA41090.1 Exocyst complex component [Komagataella phaffii CBS 7435]
MGGDYSLRKSRAPKGDWKQYEPDASLPYHKGQDQGATNELRKISTNASTRVQRRLSVKLNSTPMTTFTPHNAPSLPGNMHDLWTNDVAAVTNDNLLTVPHTTKPRRRGFSNLSARSFDFDADPEAAQTLPNLLAQSDFDCVEYVRKELANADAQKIDEFANNLLHLQKKAEADFKISVAKSEHEIVQIKDDILETKHQLKDLGSSINELYLISGQLQSIALKKLHEEEANNQQSTQHNTSPTKNFSRTGSVLNRKRDRSSILMVEKLWQVQMNELFKQIEGIQKFLSFNPGRHIIAESSRWFELNSATMKPLQPAHLFILNDHVLIATRKKLKTKINETGNQVGNKSLKQLIATQCWPIRDLSVKKLELKKFTDAKTFTIALEYKKMSFIYQTDRQEPLDLIVGSFRRTKDDLSDFIEQQRQNTESLRNSMSRLSISEDSIRRHSSKLHDLSHKVHSRNRSMEHGSQDKIKLSSSMGNMGQDELDFRTEGLLPSPSHSKAIIEKLTGLEDTLDEVDIHLVHQQFPDAVDSLKQLSSQLNSILPTINLNDKLSEGTVLFDLLKVKLTMRQESIIKSLNFELNRPSISDEKVYQIVQLLSSLDLEKIARDSLFESKANLIEKLNRSVVFEGDIPSYVSQLTIIRFQTLKATCQLYRRCFPNKEMNCYLIEFVTNQINQHADILKRQLKGVDEKSSSYIDCLEITKSQSNELKEIGVNVDFLMEDTYAF